MRIRFAVIPALMALATPTLAITQVPITYTAHPQVKQVICLEGRGTAFRIGKDRYVTAAHVSDNSLCSIDGVPVTPKGTSDYLDVATVGSNPLPGKPLEINCGGFRDGEFYYSIGYAKGLPTQRLIVLRYSLEATRIMASHVRGMDTLFGPVTVIPGMSGGPVLDSAGRVVGVVNAYNPFLGLSFSRALKDTELCK